MISVFLTFFFPFARRLLSQRMSKQMMCTQNAGMARLPHSTHISCTLPFTHQLANPCELAFSSDFYRETRRIYTQNVRRKRNKNKKGKKAVARARSLRLYLFAKCRIICPFSPFAKNTPRFSTSKCMRRRKNTTESNKNRLRTPKLCLSSARARVACAFHRVCVCVCVCFWSVHKHTHSGGFVTSKNGEKQILSVRENCFFFFFRLSKLKGRIFKFTICWRSGKKPIGRH